MADPRRQPEAQPGRRTHLGRRRSVQPGGAFPLPRLRHSRRHGQQLRRRVHRLSIEVRSESLRAGLLCSSDRRDLRSDSLGFSLNMLRDGHAGRSLRRGAWREQQAHAWVGGHHTLPGGDRLDWELSGGLRRLPAFVAWQRRVFAAGLRWRPSRRFEHALQVSQGDHRLNWHQVTGKSGRSLRLHLAHWIGTRPATAGYGAWPFSQDAGSRAWGRRAGISWTPGRLGLKLALAELRSLRPGPWEIPDRRDWGMQVHWKQQALELRTQFSSISGRHRYGVQVNRRLSRLLSLRTGLRTDSPTGRKARSLFFQIRADRKNEGMRVHLAFRHGERSPPVQALSPAPGVLWLLSGSQEQSRFGIGCWKRFGKRDKGRLHIRIALELASKRREKRSAQEGLMETSSEWRSTLNLVWKRP